MENTDIVDVERTVPHAEIDMERHVEGARGVDVERHVETTKVVK